MVCRGTWEAIKRSNSNSTYIYFHIAFYIYPFGALGGAWALGGSIRLGGHREALEGPMGRLGDLWHTVYFLTCP